MSEALSLLWQRVFIAYYEIWVGSPNPNGAYPTVVHIQVNTSITRQGKRLIQIFQFINGSARIRVEFFDPKHKRTLNR